MSRKGSKANSRTTGAAELAYALGRSTLGSVLVAQGPLGVSAILLGDDPARLVRDLRKAFPEARLVESEAALAGALAQAIGLVEEPWRTLDLPLDIGGTEFQRRVWRLLREIPSGTTVSYAEIARRLGAPLALRAVAGACAANILALAIPCHRVLRANGSLSGYRWGMERKRLLIEREQKR